MQRPSELDALGLEVIGDSSGPVCTADFFVVTKAEIDAAFGFKAVVDKQFDGGEHGDERAFVVHCAAAPDDAVCNAALKGGIGPSGAGVVFYRDNIVVGGEQDGFEGRIRALPQV